MKTSIGIGVALVIMSAACGGDEKGSTTPAVTPPPAATQTEPPPVAAPPARKLVTKTAMATSPENLVIDPQFQSLWTAMDETGMGIYEAYAIDAKSEVRFVPTSPVGPDAAALTVTAQSTEPSITMMVVGGKGPLSASAWISAPAGEEPDVNVAALYDSTMVSLTPDVDAAQTHGEVRYVPYRATLPQDLPGQLYFSITPTGKKPIVVIAPEVRVAAQQDHHRARNAVRASSAVVRGMRALEALRASHTTMSLPPRLPPQAAGKRFKLRVGPMLR